MMGPRRVVVVLGSGSAPGCPLLLVRMGKVLLMVVVVATSVLVVLVLLAVLLALLGLRWLLTSLT